MKINPFEAHPDIEQIKAKKKKKNYLTKEHILFIIDKQIKRALSSPRTLGGFQRVAILEAFEALKEEVRIL